MKMKKNITVLTAMLLLGVFMFTACGTNDPVEPEPAVTAEPPVIEATPVYETEPEPASVEVCSVAETYALLSEITGFWLLSHATDEAGESVDVGYSDWLIYTIEIRGDYTFTWSAYGALSGELIYAGDNSFTAFNLVAKSEGQTWYPEADEVTISYDSQSGLLRYTRVFNYPDSPTADVQIMYYTRMEESPYAESVFQTSIVKIDFATGELLSNFSHVYEFDYSEVHDAEVEFGVDLVFWSDILIKDFSIIAVYFDAVISVIDAWDVASEILPGEAIVVNAYHGGSSLAASGFSFVDENGVTRYFIFVENMGYPYEPGPYRWLVHEFDGTTGQIIELMVS